jgi:hypothetical protein
MRGSVIGTFLGLTLLGMAATAAAADVEMTFYGTSTSSS